MLKSIKQITLIIFSALLFNSCGGEDLPFVPDDGTPISFTPQVDNANTTRGEAITSATMKSFGVYASVDATTPFLLMEDEQIYRNQNNWTYDNIKYWPLNQTVSFYAYSPYGNNNVSYSYADKTISCLIPDNPDSQFDLISAEAPGKSATDGTVGLLFEHLLSRVDFAVNPGNAVDNTDITLNSFELVIKEDALYNRGVYNITTDNWTINNGSFISGGTFPLITTPTNIPDEGWKYSMILLPQEHPAGTLTANISYTVRYNDTVLADKQASIPLLQIVCEKGKKYTYNFGITITGVTLEVNVLPWNTEEKEIEL